jgi:hypothetical protein
MTKKMIYSLPKLYNREQLNIILNVIYNDIKQVLIDCIVNNPVEFEFMKNFGLTPNQRIEITSELSKQLEKITNNHFNGWCDTINFNIINSISGALSSLQKMNKINNFTPDEMVDFVYNIIVYQIDDFEHSPCISDDLLIDIE